MIVFRCSRCSKVNISTEGYRCSHCGKEETSVPSIPENTTKVRSTSTNGNEDFLYMQNKGTCKTAGTDFSVPAQTYDKCNAAKLDASEEKHIKTMNAVASRISSSQGEPVRTIIQNSILKEMQILSCPVICSNSLDGTYYPSPESGAIVPTKKLKHISGQSSRHKSKYNLKVKKNFNNKNTKSIAKLNLGNSLPYTPEKSVLDCFTKDDINVNQLKDSNIKANSGKQLSKKSNQNVNSSLQDDLKITKASSQEVFSKGCLKNDLCEKLPINRIKTPISKKFFLCSKCKKTFTDESKLRVHFVNHFKEKRFKCDSCDKEYFSEAHLKRHYQSHMNKAPFKCDLCDLVFTRNCHLSRHRKKHILERTEDSRADQEKVVESSQQREQETSDDDPQKHFQTSAKEKIFLCTECDTKFICESNFNAHSLRHNAQKPFKCNKCSREFRYETDLDKHYRIHSLERPFTCEICGFSFTQGSNLYKHLKIHA